MSIFVSRMLDSASAAPIDVLRAADELGTTNRVGPLPLLEERAGVRAGMNALMELTLFPPDSKRLMNVPIPLHCVCESIDS